MVMARSAALALLCLSVCGYALHVTEEALASEDVCSDEAGTSCALNELQATARTGLHVEKENFSVAAVCTPDSKDECPCAIHEIQKESPLPLIPGSKDNMHGMPPDLDLRGIWWIHWRFEDVNAVGNPYAWNKAASAAGVFVYKNILQLEQLFSWARTNSTSTSYPTNLTMHSPGAKYEWAYGPGFLARWFQTFIHWNVGSIQWTMYNASFGVTSGASAEASITANYQLIATDDPDRWLRPTCTRPPTCFTYSMTRIQNVDGSKTKHWDAYVKTAPETNYIYTTNDLCRRRSLGFWSLALWLFPSTWLCPVVNYLCENVAPWRYWWTVVV